jgi:predicted dehydrogenase
MNVGIIGCGVVGIKRAQSLGEHQLSIAVDVNITRAERMARSYGNHYTRFSTNPLHAIFNKDIDLIIISTTNDHLAHLTLQSVIHGKHVLVEKPAGRNSKELIPIIKESERKNVFVKVGFNHRFHPSLMKAKEMVKSDLIGELMFVRGRYGHGGRLGYEKEWRSDPEKSGGGELIDQGVHLIDLSRWFIGDLKVENSYIDTFFWNMPVEDNAFLTLRNKDKLAWLHVSCTEWKNMFSFEIYGKTGKLMIDGLGGSYGTEKLTYYQMHPEMGIPDVTEWRYDDAIDYSWKLEFDYFVDCIQNNKKPEGDISDAKKVLDIVSNIYNNQ